MCPPVVQYYYVVCEMGEPSPFLDTPPILIGTPMGRWRHRSCAAHVLWMKVPRVAVIVCVKGGAIANLLHTLPVWSCGQWGVWGVGRGRIVNWVNSGLGAGRLDDLGDIGSDRETLRDFVHLLVSFQN